MAREKQIYKEQLEPLLEKVAEICWKEGIAFVGAVEFPREGGGSEFYTYDRYYHNKHEGLTLVRDLSDTVIEYRSFEDDEDDEDDEDGGEEDGD